MLKKFFKKRINEIYEKYKDKKLVLVDDISNFFGLESSGVWKVRGNGVLLLTEEELFFGMWKPKIDLVISIKSIIEVLNPKSHMQRSVFRPLLKIVFTNDNGVVDSAAWYVRKLDDWNKALNKLILKDR
ncbi:MAG: hypothetical protein R3255_00060 [Candidatus Lokiarchaeia archaeon]|nr:hypothetical protein [Candidatus Lokiarchaeia archaeon]